MKYRSERGEITFLVCAVIFLSTWLGFVKAKRDAQRELHLLREVRVISDRAETG